jgi:polyhydroxybutyrate depolymerase
MPVVVRSGTTSSRLCLGGAFMALLAGGLLLSSCSSNGGGDSATGGHTSTTSTTTKGTGGSTPARGTDPTVDVDLQGRTYDIYLPPDLDPAKPVPLLLELHGFVGSNSTMTPWLDEEAANQFKPEAAKRGIILVLPHGTIDPVLNHFFWNATNACCDLDDQKPNDIGYLMAIIADVGSKYSVDPKRIFAFGHSNGGFMVNRMACDQADKIAGIVSMAGETYLDQTKCAASAPIAFLQVQGDADMTVPYGGGSPEGVAELPHAPGAVETTQDWAVKNDCQATPDTTQPQIQLMSASTAPDTAKQVYTGCQANGDTELWTIHNGPHSPAWAAAWAPDVFDFFMAHPKP